MRERLRAIVRASRSDYVWLGAIATIAQAFYSLTPIGFEADALEYYLYAQFLSGLPPAPFAYHPPRFIYYRPPGYPVFLLITGLIHLDTFRWTLLASALIGIGCPLLLYATIAPIGRVYAIVAALVYIVSTLPFSYSHVFLADHLYTVLVLGVLFAVCRGFYRTSAMSLYLAAGFALCAMMTRNEAWTVFLVAAVALTVQTFRRPRLLLHLAVAVALALGVTAYWSHLRSQYMGDPKVFGSLSNFAGRQAFWRVYVSLPVWDRALHEAIRSPLAPAQLCETDFGPGTCLVSPDNGPRSRLLYGIVEEAIARPSGEEPFVHPTSAESWAIGEAVTSRRDYLGADRLFRDVVRETLVAHPSAFVAMLAMSLDYVGINSIYLLELMRTHAWRRFFPVLRVSVDDDYERIPLNHSGIALRTLMHPRLRHQYIASYYPKPSWFWPLHGLGQVASKIVKNVVGVAFVTSLLFLVWLPRRHWPAALFLIAVAGALIGAATIGYGYSAKYHHTILPVLMIAVCYELRGLEQRLTRATVPRPHSS